MSVHFVPLLTLKLNFQVSKKKAYKDEVSDSPSDSDSDFDEDEDPDKIEVPGNVFKVGPKWAF